MDTETQHSQEHDFGSSSPWVEMGGGYNHPQQQQHHHHHHHSSPIHEMNGFAYGPSPIMPMEPSYSMSIPPPYTSQPLLPLAMPSQWPSMLTTQSSYAAAPLTAAPLSSISTASNMHQPHATHVSTGPTPRRTLTDSDRRRMCLYHEENPHVKQTEIGGKSCQLNVYIFSDILVSFEMCSANHDETKQPYSE